MPSEIKSSFTYWCFWYAGVQVTVISRAQPRKFNPQKTYFDHISALKPYKGGFTAFCKHTSQTENSGQLLLSFCVASCADIFWAHHAICLSHDRHSAEANGTFLPFCFRPSRSQTLDPEKFERDSLKKRTQAWPFLDFVNIKSVDLITLWATGCKVF